VPDRAARKSLERHGKGATGSFKSKVKLNFLYV
jgi:hypothetical protein